MKAIGINTIRVYTTEPTGDHDGCMQAFASQGIYVWVDLASPLYSINRADPSYTMELFDQFSSVIDTFSKYNNTLSFTAANELINSESTVSVAPYIKAVVRDLKAFRNARGYRKIPISYTSADISELQLATKNYLSCGGQDDAIEMFGMNVYSWCGNSSYTQSGYDKVYTQFQDSSIPALFAETGCNTYGARTFGEVAAILGSVFPATFSGCIVYEWPQEANGYGLVEYPRSDDTGFPSTLADYSNLGKVYTTASPVSTALTAYTPSNSPPACPASNSDWPLAGTASLPTIKGLDVDTISARTTYYTSADVTRLANAAASTTTGTDSGSGSGSTGSPAPEAQTALSTGAIAGIAIGGAVVGIAFAVIGFFLLRRRRNQRTRGEGSATSGSDVAPSSGDSAGFKKAELPASSSADPMFTKQELHADHVQEKDAAPKLHEMDPAERPRVYEMPGSGLRTPELEGSGAARESK